MLYNLNNELINSNQVVIKQSRNMIVKNDGESKMAMEQQSKNVNEKSESKSHSISSMNESKDIIMGTNVNKNVNVEDIDITTSKAVGKGKSKGVVKGKSKTKAIAPPKTKGKHKSKSKKKNQSADLAMTPRKTPPLTKGHKRSHNEKHKISTTAKGKSKPKSNEASGDSPIPTLTPLQLQALPHIELVMWDGTQSISKIDATKKIKEEKYNLVKNLAPNNSAIFEEFIGLRCVFNLKGRNYFVLSGC